MIGRYLLLALVVAVPLGVSLYPTFYQSVDEAPGFTLTSTGYEDGMQGEPVEFSLSEYRNKTLLIDFMAIACTSCRNLEALVLEPIWEEYQDNPDFELISIDTWADPGAGSVSFGAETQENLQQFQADHGHDWRHALDSDDVYLKYNAISLPKIAIIGPEGQIVAEFTGIPDRSDVEAAIERSLAGEAASGSVFRLPFEVGGPTFLIAAALVAGIASFFAPCSVGLIPAYMGFLLQGTQGLAPATRTARTLRAGFVTGFGVVTVYGVLALLLWGLSLAGYDAVIRQRLPQIAPVIAVLLIVFGTLMFFKVSWDWLAKRMGLGHVDGRRGFYAFGVGYGLAAFGCTGPIFLPILLAGFIAGAGTGLLVFLAYSLAIASFVVLAAALVATGHEGRLNKVLAKTDLITKISAGLLVAAGLYLLWFEYQSGVFS